MVQLLSNQQFLATCSPRKSTMELAPARHAGTGGDWYELPMQQGPAAIQAYVEARPVLHHLFNGGLVVYDRAGAGLASVPPARRGRHLSTGCRTDCLGHRSGYVTVGWAFLGERLDTPAFAMAAPIRDEHGGVVGIMV